VLVPPIGIGCYCLFHKAQCAKFWKRWGKVIVGLFVTIIVVAICAATAIIGCAVAGAIGGFLTGWYSCIHSTGFKHIDWNPLHCDDAIDGAILGFASRGLGNWFQRLRSIEEGVTGGGGPVRPIIGPLIRHPFPRDLFG
jgi:hypothetical protein